LTDESHIVVGRFVSKTSLRDPDKAVGVDFANFGGKELVPVYGIDFESHAGFKVFRCFHLFGCNGLR